MLFLVLTFPFHYCLLLFFPFFHICRIYLIIQIYYFHFVIDPILLLRSFSEIHLVKFVY